MGMHELVQATRNEVNRLQEEVEKLRAENAELRADAERLEWLSDKCTYMDTVSDPDNLYVIWCGDHPQRKTYGKTLRAAIDAARKDQA